MMFTPSRSCDELQPVTPLITPVRFLASPGTKSPKSGKLFIIRSRLDEILTNVIDNHSKWRSAEVRGLKICKSIEAVKTRCLERKANSYHSDLKPLCDRLANITLVLQEISLKIKEALKQVQTLTKLPENNTEIIYRTWNIERFINNLEITSRKFEAEYSVKKFVMEEIAHCRTRADLVRLTSFWEYPQHVDGFVQLIMKFFAEEIKC